MGSKPDLTRARWHKSSYSGSSGGECVEVASLTPGMAVRDSKNQHGPVLRFPTAAWSAFVESVKR
ncbi:DUF397 domain-containing protein [Streptomyces sp. NPDC048521]|uniref:DUF397 domain-containing protein n=1 Tax=Streptomyces sp. NPDC048521 TaxID=3365566 RepID=UPI00371E78A6